jgi:hypothetical protein
MEVCYFGTSIIKFIRVYVYYTATAGAKSKMSTQRLACVPPTHMIHMFHRNPHKQTRGVMFARLPVPQFLKMTCLVRKHIHAVIQQLCVA